MTFDTIQQNSIEELFACRDRQGETPLHSVMVDGQELEITPVFQCYWEFAAKRQQIFRDRIHDRKFNESNDRILAHYKFTNAYRASDRVSQYLIRDVIYKDNIPHDIENTFFRIILFKIFNNIQTWEALESEFGNIELTNFTLHKFDDFLTDRLKRGIRNYSAAYVMPSAGSTFRQTYKHSNHLHLLNWMLEKSYPSKLHNANTMKDGFQLFLAAPSIGHFLAYQYVTDINYSEITDFSEREFVVAGPGALDGISKCFGDTKGVSPSSIIRYMTESQYRYFSKIKPTFRDLWGRNLQFIDCQNLFCEISKYARVAFPEIRGVSNRFRIKQKFKPKGRLALPMYPISWNLNDKIEAEFSAEHSTNFKEKAYVQLDQCHPEGCRETPQKILPYLEQT